MPTPLDSSRPGRRRAASATTERRDSQRTDLLGALRGEVMVFQPTAVRQISTGGMEVETSFPLQLDSLHEFRLTLRERSLVVKGRVVHSAISDVDQDVVIYRSGIEFVEPPNRVVGVIGQFLEAAKHVRR
ncbi:MAG: PilZ domain-containing protein [Acidobacteria bacterium]|nr:PilZ domain-containing protein [Acidobacteriota bacterium]